MGVWDSIASAKSLQPVPESGFSDLQDLRSALDLIDLDEAVAALEGPPRVGRRVSPRRPILRAYLASRYLGIGSLSALIARLHNDPALRSVAGFTDSLPSYATFWRVFDRLTGMPELIARCCDDLLDRLAELAPDLGQEVAVDATTIVAYANPNRKHTARNPDGPADADASWTKKNSARDPSPQEWFSAIKPMWSPTPTATCRWAWLSLRPVGTIRRFCRRRFRNWRLAIPGSAWRQSRRASPTGDMIPEAITGSSIGTARVPVIHQRGLPDGKLHDGIYAAEGAPTCLGGRWRMSALFPIPGITCTAARRAVAPGVIQRTLFPPAMTRRGRTRRVISNGSAGASGGVARSGRRWTPSGGTWSRCPAGGRSRAGWSGIAISVCGGYQRTRGG